MEGPDKAAGAWQDLGRGPSKPHCSKGSTPSSLGSDTATSTSQSSSGISWCHHPTQAGSSQVLNKSLTISISPILIPSSQEHTQPILGGIDLERTPLPRGATIKQGNITAHIKQLAQLEPSGYHLPWTAWEHLEQVQHREQQSPSTPPARVPCAGDLQAAAGTHPRVQLPGRATRRCCCGMAAPGARRSGGLRHSSAGTTGDSHTQRGHETPGFQGPASPGKGQSQRLLVKRAWKWFYPHATRELGSAEAVALGGNLAAGDVARGDMEPCSPSLH